MATYQIITDSCSDLPESYCLQNNILSLPLTFTIEGSDYQDRFGREMSPTLFYGKLRGGQTATTTLINNQRYADAFIPLLEKGMDILYIAFSSALSGCYQSALLARTEIGDRFPDRQIVIVDSLCASLGLGLLVYQTVERRDQGWELDPLTAWLEENKQHVIHWFTVDDLNFLRRGGRVSATAAMLGTILSIKPVLHVNDQGRLIPVEKVRSRKRALQALVDHMGETVIEPMQQTVFISHGDAMADAEAVAALVKERFQVKNVIINYVGPVIGSHSGPGTIALFYLGKTRSPGQ